MSSGASRIVGRPNRAEGKALPWLLLIVAAAAVAWWYFAPHTLPDAISSIVPASPKSNPTLYKWKDDKGQLHVTDKPPSDRPYEAVKYDPNTNVMPSPVKPPR
jgi:Domain of unknown function (DUF4124)